MQSARRASEQACSALASSYASTSSFSLLRPAPASRRAFSYSVSLAGKSRPGEGKDARQRARVLARSGGNQVSMKDVKDPPRSFEDAAAILKAAEAKRPNNAYEVHIVTSVNTHQSNALRGRVSLPRDARTKPERLLIFADEMSPAYPAAKAAAEAANATAPGSIILGGQEIINDVVENRISDFSKVLATPSLMPQISRALARSLGPKGLMPNPKRGTVANTEVDMRNAIRDATGALDWRGDRNGVVRAAIGRINFPLNDLRSNLNVFLDAVMQTVHTITQPAANSAAGAAAALQRLGGSNKPAFGVHGERTPAEMKKALGIIKQVHLSSTQGPGVRLNLPDVL
ncbi:hypothetical protein OC846_000533 [Tilletia horrida]|uniref:Ribosomal protein n=1 Tax=Tilletia horrida TaxID=155126 RepID=A0AAN6JUL3_9BASI|nr:hypothetical protein OC845_000604 [Tilletia horrida]KAK0557314.1 hypothetical protein OC846_000533 [Tilletia horrida]KAK0569622.1 hypothetical protein OC861_000704 [Tilletia horrida]